jgi:hypothetical protein
MIGVLNEVDAALVYLVEEVMLQKDTMVAVGLHSFNVTKLKKGHGIIID